MTRSSRSSTVTASRASKVAENQLPPPSRSSPKKVTPTNGKPIARSSPRAQRKKGIPNQTGDGEDSDESESEEETVKRAQKRKSTRWSGSPQSKKIKADKGVSNGVDKQNGSVSSSDDDADTTKATSKRPEQKAKSTKKGNTSDKTTPNNNNKKKGSSREEEEEDEKGSDDWSDPEVSLPGLTRGSKQKALETMNAITALEADDNDEDYEESDIEEILDSDDEEAGEDGDSEMDSDDDEGEMDSEDEEAMKIEQQEFNAHFGKQAMEKLKIMKEEFEKALKQKGDEVKRLKNELEFKDQQLEDMSEITTKNMELEASISAMLSGPEGYKAEVDAIAKKQKAEEDAKKAKIEEEEEKEEENKKKEKAEKGKETKKAKVERKKSQADSDIEEISEEEFSEGKAEKSKSPRKRRGRRKKEEEDEGPKIEALFVSDDEDEELKEKDKDKKSKKGKKKEKDEDNDIEVIEVKSGDEGDDKDKGRHNIRKLMGDKKLASETKAAALEEKDRIERVAKLKEKHQIESHIDNKTKQPVYTKMVLAFKKDQKTPLVEVNTKLLKKLKPHQVDAVEFLWDSVIETTERLRRGESGSGCIVAHCMGLGKTLSVITFVHTLLTTRCLKMKTCLVVCPLNTVLNWEHEWTKWLDKRDRLPTYEMASAKDNNQRAELLEEWQQEGGIMIMGYQIFRILANSTTKSKKKKKIFEESLVCKGADIVVCDEGHVLKNDASAISKCMNRIRSKRRIILTGTPLQNNLVEYHCMVSFVKPSLLGSRKEFCNKFVNPITNGQHADSTSYDVKLMKRRAHVLHNMLSGCVQRRDYSALVKFLPPKSEYIISVRLSPLQMTLYEKYLERFVERTADSMYRGTSLFSDYQALMRIWTHPWVLKMDEIRQEKKAQYTEDDDDELGSFLASDTSDEEEDETDTSSKSAEGEEEEGSKAESDIEIIEKPTRRSSRRSQNKETEKDNKNSQDDDKKDGKKNKEKENDKKEEDTNGSDAEITEEVNVRRAKLVAGEVIKHWQSNSRRKGADEEGPEKKVEAPWWVEYVNEEEHKQKIELSGKLVILFDILRMAEGLGDKVLVFSQSLLSLDLIEEFLSYKNEEAEKLRDGKKGKAASGIPLWLKDEDYCRMDGSTSAQNRTKYTATFNSMKNKRMRLFLISTKAGGLGINLDSANRVVIFDASWNPSHDIQSIFRAYRFGQEKDVFIYRLLAQGTMEEKIYERQVTKESLSQRVIDEQQMDRHFSANDLQELYIFKPDRLDDPDRKERPTPKVPKDLILTELLSERKEWVVGYHEHDSLLEKRPDEDLDEDERKAAWEEYEKEKQGFYQYRGPAVPVTMYNYRPPIMTSYARPPIAAMAQHAAAFSMMRPIMNNVGPGVGGSAIAAQHGFTTDQAKLNFQLSQLPRVVQEILKYNPNITPTELQSRLRAFMGMHTKYSDVPGFAMPKIEVSISGKQRTITCILPGVSNNGSESPSNGTSTPNIDQNPANISSGTSTGTSAGTSAGTSTGTSAGTSSGTSSGAWSGTAGVSPSQLSNLITESIVTATTGNMPSRLPQPGKVPGSSK